jgi:hypothetical protein
MNGEIQMLYDVDIGGAKSKEWAEVCKGGRTVWVRGSRSALIFRLSDVRGERKRIRIACQMGSMDHRLEGRKDGGQDPTMNLVGK